MWTPAIVLLGQILRGSGNQCCNTKVVGEHSYTLLSEGPVPKRCSEGCVYSRNSSPGSRYCFAPGNLPVQCTYQQDSEQQYDRGILCQPDQDNQFVFSVSFHSPGRNGEYQVTGCEGTSPTLAMVRGVTYTMVQHHPTNWMHPLGLAYYPDGAHGFQEFNEVPELEYPTTDDCDLEQFLCNPGKDVKQAPLYGIDGDFETFADWNNGVVSGLDVYEPAFQIPQDQWAAHNYSIKITVPENSKTERFFYFCHIHDGMSGEIKITGQEKEGTNTLVQPFNPADYYQDLLGFDHNCGTFGTSKYHHEKQKYCPGQNFLCNMQHNKEFYQCMEAINCKMNYEMRVEENPNPLVVFMHQMIPHHENAVNMARIALKHATDAEGYDDKDLDVPGLLRDIINVQNKQIMDMKHWLSRQSEHGHSLNGMSNPQFCEPPKF